MNRQNHSDREEEQPLQSSQDEVLDPKAHRFPLCVVWCPIPIITWILPFVGHAGICSSDATINDFQGDFSIHVCLSRYSFTFSIHYFDKQKDKDTTIFGKVTKYWVLDLNKSNVHDSSEFDSVLNQSVATFKHKHVCFHRSL